VSNPRIEEGSTICSAQRVLLIFSYQGGTGYKYKLAKGGAIFNLDAFYLEVQWGASSRKTLFIKRSASHSRSPELEALDIHLFHRKLTEGKLLLIYAVVEACLEEKPLQGVGGGTSILRHEIMRTAST